MKQLFSIILILPFSGFAQESKLKAQYHEEDSLIFQWIQTVNDDPELTATKKTAIMTDSIRKVEKRRNVTHWEYHDPNASECDKARFLQIKAQGGE